MGRITLMLGIHNHQPVGNFEHVFRDAYDRCYRPFFDELAEHPAVRISLHCSGPLLDWMDSNEPSFLDALRKRVKAGQVELLTGAYYEPILAAIPSRDGAGQIRMMNRYLKRRLGGNPKGLWLAERVWEPSLPALLGSSGVSFTLLDDTHFQAVGLKPESLHGYYLTEREGISLGIFPISRRLRYLIPFRPPEETIDYLDRLSGRGEIGVTYADDGEKFGIWPGTYDWVYGGNWLKHFFRLLESNRSWIETTTFGDFHARNPPTGRIYLPTASYEEMMEWALPADAILEREALVERLIQSGLDKEVEGFLRGGLWNHFLVKYPEINWMHKKALRVSDRLVDRMKSYRSEPRWLDEARRELYRAQGNDAYWHGLFGGYYLNYLRHAVYQHLLRAENLVPPSPSGSPIRLTETDLDHDGHPELIVESARMNLYLKPCEGATAVEIDYRPKTVCLTHVPMRRPEAYHRKLGGRPAPNAPGSTGIASIHDRVAVKATAANIKPVYDRYPRWSFRDHLMRADTTLENFETGGYDDLGGFSDQPYEAKSTRVSKKEAVLSFRRAGVAGDRPLGVRKVYRISATEARLDLEYTIDFSRSSERRSGATRSPAGLRRRGRAQPDRLETSAYVWAVEMNLTLLAGDDPKRYYRFPGKIVEDSRLRSRGGVEDLSEVHLVDEWQGLEIRLEFDPAVRLWRFPVETISQSEEGLEAVYQGSCLVPAWLMARPDGIRAGQIRMEIRDR
jgi:4-alpha-glucanotransferase